MAWAKVLEVALRQRLGDKVVFLDDWQQVKRKPWPRKGVPLALMVHHTAGAATDSRDPKNPGNQKGANAGVIKYVQNHFQVPAANFTLDRDGTVYVHSAWPVWHAGRGSFKGVQPYERLGIGDNLANDFTLGVECVSKGLKRDFTKAQKVSLGKLANACKDAAGWKGFHARLPNHKTWAPNRKIDSRYSLLALRRWARLYQ
jgi:hypothetical protein